MPVPVAFRCKTAPFRCKVIASLWIATPFRWKVIVSLWIAAPIRCKVIVSLCKAAPILWKVIVSLCNSCALRCKAGPSLCKAGAFCCKTGYSVRKTAVSCWIGPIIQKKGLILIKERMQICKKTKTFMIDDAVCHEISFVKKGDASRLIINLNYAER